MTLRPRNVVVLLFSLLLLGMQLEGQRHELMHLGDTLRGAHEQGVQKSSVDAPCVECGLLAGGSHSLTPGIASLSFPEVAAGPIAAAFRSYDVPAPHYYSSRAPPVLL